ncbi:MAG: hypothetical protein GY820_02400 [Gammaproteobacteria bacterium]|nr:hypothetical protein [Gammaproteobacteria bacterium]
MTGPIAVADRRSSNVSYTFGKITTIGHRYLGSYIGTEEGVKDFIMEETESWKADIQGLVEIASKEPQLAYSAFTYGTSKRWNFVCRTTPDIGSHLKHLEHCVKESFIPAIMGKTFVPDQIREIISLQQGWVASVSQIAL